MTNLGATCSTLANAESNEYRVGHFHQDVIDAIDMQVLDTRCNHFIEQFILTKSLVQSSVAIWNKINSLSPELKL